jgi:hypothetical protein
VQRKEPGVSNYTPVNVKVRLRFTLEQALKAERRRGMVVLLL